MDKDVDDFTNPDRQDEESIGNLEDSTKQAYQVNDKIEEPIDAEEISEKTVEMLIILMKKKLLILKRLFLLQEIMEAPTVHLSIL